MPANRHPDSDPAPEGRPRDVRAILHELSEALYSDIRSAAPPPPPPRVEPPDDSPATIPFTSAPPKRQRISLQHVATLCEVSKSALRKPAIKKILPKPCRKGTGGRCDLYWYDEIRAVLEPLYDIPWPETITERWRR